MRTTITLENDVAKRLEHLRARRDANFKRLVNEALRAGLDTLEAATLQPREPYRLELVSLRPRLPDLDNIADLLAATEGETAR
ncbi:MAG: DUF2191 domain-containing protein [Gammaproteobacteria bacterium]